MSQRKCSNLLNLIARGQRRVVYSSFSAELNALVDSVESVLLLQATLHQTYCGTSRSLEELVDALETWNLRPRPDIGVDARALFDAISAADTCDPAEFSFKLYLISSQGPPGTRTYYNSALVAHKALACGRIDQR